MATTPRWEISGEYFENCNCDVVCPCEVSPKGPLKAKPTHGVCDVLMAFHLNDGKFGATSLAGLNVLLAIHTPGPMVEGNWTAAPYLDERASSEQRQALGAIFGGAAGGPLAALGPLIKQLREPRVVPMTFEKDGQRRRANIPGILDMEVAAVQGAPAAGEPVIKKNAHPLFPETVQAYGVRSSYTDHDFRWNNTGRNGDYAAFRWSGP